MFAQVTGLQYWKSDYDATTCEDAYSYRVLQGLFAMADGAGTTLFSHLWARLLVEYFIDVPLMSDDPFELEWWLRQAQERYKQHIPVAENMSWNAQQKMLNEGSYATLATLRIIEVHKSRALADLLAIGDSCIFLESDRSSELEIFPLIQEADFERAPLCLPSKQTRFQRDIQRCQKKQVWLEADDTIVLATDAVARWIISSGQHRYASPKEALYVVMSQTPASWPQFIETCRARNEMVDDDSTALIISLLASENYMGTNLRLSSTNEHISQVRQLRKKLFAEAVQANNKELMAILYGDGRDLQKEGVAVAMEDIQQARQVANALQAVLSALRESLNSPDVLKRIRPIWNKYADLLEQEQCAEQLRHSLTQLGLLLHEAPSAYLSGAAIEDQSSISNSDPRRIADLDTMVMPLPDVPSLQEPVVENAGRETPDQPLELYRSVPQTAYDLAHEEKRIELKRDLVEAFSMDDDDVILAAHYAIQASPYQIEYKTYEARRIEQAKNRADLRQVVMAALKSQNVEQMALAYERTQRQQLIISSDEQQRLLLAHLLQTACQAKKGEEVVAAFEALLHSPYQGFFELTREEETLIVRAWQQKTGQIIPTITDDWFNKVCLLKNRYLQEKKRPVLSDSQLSQQVKHDLANDYFIQQEIEEIHLKEGRQFFQPEKQVQEIFARWQHVDQQALDQKISNQQALPSLSEEEIKAALHLFIRIDLFSAYLTKRNLRLNDWLKTQRRQRQSEPLHANDQTAGGHVQLLWWRR